MEPHTFDRIAPFTFRCLACGRLTRVVETDEAPPSCDGCLEIERMETVKTEPFTSSELEPPPKDA